MNKVILMGRLTKDPEVRYSNAAEPLAIARYALAVNRRFKRENEPDADFINCVIFGKQAEFAEKYFQKGMMVAVSGRLTVREYTDNSGQRRWITEVVLDDQQFAESRASFESRKASSFNQSYEQQPYNQPNPALSEYQPPKQNKTTASTSDNFFEVDQSLDDEDLPF